MAFSDISHEAVPPTNSFVRDRVADIIVFGPPNEAHEHCTLCEMQFHSVEEQRNAGGYHDEELDDAEAQARITDTIAATESHLHHVKEKLKTHGDRVISRWFKRSRDKRRRLLIEAADWLFGERPDEPPEREQRADGCASFEDLMDDKIRVFFPNTHGDYSVWAPWIDRDDLAEDRMKLLSLFHVRTTYAQQDWAMFDNSEAAEVFSMPDWCVPYNTRGVQMYGEYFGRLVKFNAGVAHSRAVLGFPRALVTLLVQFTIALMLHQVIDTLTADAPPSGNTNWATLMTSIPKGDWTYYNDSGFMPPIVGLDTGTLLRLSRDKLNQVVDEVELMQTDPEYMREYVLSLKAGIRWDEGIPPDLKWDYVAECIWVTCTSSLGIWHSIAWECQALHDACRHHLAARGTAVLRGTWLSPEATTHYRTLTSLIHRNIRQQERCLVTVIQDMSAMKGRYKKSVKSGQVRNTVKTRGLDMGLDDPKDHSSRITLAMEMLKMSSSAETDLQQYNQGRLSISRVAKELAAVEPDKRVNDQLSDLALLDTMRLSTVWSQVLPNDSASNASKTTVPSETRTPSIWLRHNLGQALRDFVDHPFPKGFHDPLWLEKADATRKHSNKFWSGVRDLWIEAWQQLSVRPDFVSVASLSISVFESSEYLARVDDERKQYEAEAQRSKASTAPGVKASPDALQSTWGTDFATEAPKRRKRTKAKLARTHPEDELDLSSLSLEALSTEQSETPSEQTVKRTIPVKPDSLKVFNKMFHPDRANAAIRWTQLTQALTDAGLVMTQQPGSGFRFSNAQGSVAFDKPHPEPVVSPIMLRHHVGRRLGKWFGWDGETFVLREKKGEEDQAVNGSE